MRIIVVGLGGIGSNLVEPLARTLVYSQKKRAVKRILLVDGDKFEERNRERQRFASLANKAEATKEWLEPIFPELKIEAKPHFVDETNIFALVREGDAVFLCVDNHASRKLFNDHLATLQDALLISGGNELYDGNVQVYERGGGKDLSPKLIYLHPEIEHPKDRNPATVDCMELAKAGAPQILAVNLTAATLMLNTFVLWLEENPAPYYEIYFDIKTGNVRPVKLDKKG